MEDYEENHPEVKDEEDNTIGNNNVENPHTGDSILLYVATGIIAIVGIAILTNKKNR